MLFVSRLVYDDRRVECYEIYDTDDDTSEVVDPEELQHIVIDVGLTIRGVTVSVEGGRRVVSAVRVYQHKKYATRLQVKAKSLLGVDICIFKGEIVAIYLDTTTMKHRQVIRLSDFCDKISDGVVVWPLGQDWGKRVVLVLDEKISFTGQKSGIVMTPVIWDIRELPTCELVDHIYEELCEFGSENGWENFVIDSEFRMQDWRARAEYGPRSYL